MGEPAGEIVRKARKQRGLSQAAVARIASVSRPLIARIENENYRPGAAYRDSIAQALGLSAADVWPPFPSEIAVIERAERAVYGREEVEAMRRELDELYPGWRDDLPKEGEGT